MRSKFTLPVVQLARLFSWEDALKSEEQSLIFIEKILTVAVSYVLFLRNAWPGDAFQNFKCVGSLNLNLICPIESSFKPKAVRLIKNLYDVFGGIEKKYVKSLTLYILYKDSDDKAINETYTFEFFYDGEASLKLSM